LVMIRGPIPCGFGMAGMMETRPAESNRANDDGAARALFAGRMARPATSRPDSAALPSLSLGRRKGGRRHDQDRADWPDPRAKAAISEITAGLALCPSRMRCGEERIRPAARKPLASRGTTGSRQFVVHRGFVARAGGTELRGRGHGGAPAR